MTLGKALEITEDPKLSQNYWWVCSTTSLQTSSHTTFGVSSKVICPALERLLAYGWSPTYDRNMLLLVNT